VLLARSGPIRTGEEEEENALRKMDVWAFNVETWQIYGNTVHSHTHTQSGVYIRERRVCCAGRYRFFTG
jgi:hypothetical protein